MASILWDSADVSTVISTGMNSLQPELRCVSQEINNSSGLYLFNDVELFLNTNNQTPRYGSVVELYLLSAINNTNFEDGSVSINPSPSSLVGVFNIMPSSSSQRQTLKQITIPPCKYKYLLINKTGVDMPPNNNTLKIVPYRYKTIQSRSDNLYSKQYILQRTTTNSTQSLLTLDGNQPSNLNILQISTKNTWTIKAQISLYNNTDNESAGFIVKGVFKRNNSGVISRVGNLSIESWYDTSLENATVDIVANNSTNSVDVAVNGISGKQIKWICVIDSTQSSF
jgi:hypothetical protein